MIEKLQNLNQEAKESRERSAKDMDELIKRNSELSTLCETLRKEKFTLSENHQNLEKNYKNLHQEIK